MKPEYDCTADTLWHIKRVNELLIMAAKELLLRATRHDDSKLSDIEKETFDVFTPKLKDSTYGSKEYKGYLASMEVALKHHYTNNSHHPEHYKGGLSGFDLFDLIEMFLDWKAATERHADGDIMRSIKHNQKRFGYPDLIADVFKNTAIRYLRDKKTAVIAGFPGVGKTHCFERLQWLDALDSDSSLFSRDPLFPINYMEHIKSKLNTVNVIFVSTHIAVPEALIANDIKFHLVYPDKSLQEEYIARYKYRDTGRCDPIFLKLLETMWDQWMAEMEAQQGCEKYILQSKEYLSDIIEPILEVAK
jgi:hypothetical protein